MPTYTVISEELGDADYPSLESYFAAIVPNELTDERILENVNGACRMMGEKEVQAAWDEFLAEREREDADRESDYRWERTDCHTYGARSL